MIPDSKRKPLNADQVAWLAALRSGKYKRGTKCLHYLNPVRHHCCLGVAMEISGRVTWVSLPNAFSIGIQWRETPQQPIVDGHESSTTYLDSMTSHQLDLSIEEQIKISQANDSRIKLDSYDDVIFFIEKLWFNKGYDVLGFDGN